MHYIKLTVMFHTFDALFEFRRTQGASFWDVFGAKMREICPDYAAEKMSDTYCMFYFPTSQEEDSLQARIEEMLQDLTGGKEDWILAASQMEASDLNRLQAGNVDDIIHRSWFRDATAALSGSENAQRNAQSTQAVAQPAAAATHETAAAAQQTAAQTAQTEKPKPVADPPQNKKSGSITEPCPTLFGEAQKIEEFRQNLLAEVRGQRHAVDEVVQTLFECDAFALQDEKRVKPLATFLFTGPSGVGKTFLAEVCAKNLAIDKPLVVDMSEYSDNLANNRFNGAHGEDAVVTRYVRDHPNGGLILFDEIEKAHINTIHLFLQILDRGVLMDERIHKEVSFRNMIIMITTNAGASLYEDSSVHDLSGVPRKVILEALRSDLNPATKEPSFPECITTRFANGHVILFNHLEPYALMQIISDEINKQIGFFRKAYGVTVEYDPRELAAMVLYHSGGVSDARTLRGIAKNILVKELQDAIVQTYFRFGEDVNLLKTIRFSVNLRNAEDKVQELFETSELMHVITFADAFLQEQITSSVPENVQMLFFSSLDECKKRARGVVDYVLLDPTCGMETTSSMPYDIEDIRSDGMELFEYLQKYYPELPVYLLDTRRRGKTAFSTLLAKGARDVLEWNADYPAAFRTAMEQMSFNVLINNHSFALGRSGKVLNYNCSQYLQDSETVQVIFDRLSIGISPSSADRGMIAGRDEQNGVRFDDVIGCKKAKEALQEFCRFVENPRELLLSGKRIPKGVLLYGPPGTGKTMLAKAMATETQAAFLPATATSFFSPLVGQSEGAVRDLFRRARKYAPAVIFIDEVDAVGRMRTGAIGSTHNEDVLNAFLAEMDGFVTDPRRPVFIVAATNYEISGNSGRVLDPAFVRRFDRRILVDLPDTEERKEFLLRNLKRHGVHFGDKHEEIVQNMAQRSSGMSNADLEIVVDMFLRSISDKEPTGGALMEALEGFRFGEVNKLDPKELRQTACHEAGHALICMLLDEVPSFLTVVARGNFGGYMEHAEHEGKATYSYNELMNLVCCSLAGRAAEIEVYGEEAGMNTGASSDLEHARVIIRRALNDFAMGKNMYRHNSSADAETLMQDLFRRARDLIARNRAVLEELTDLLTQEKSLDKTQLEAFFATRTLQLDE